MTDTSKPTIDIGIPEEVRVEIASELGRGILEQVYIRGQNGYVLLMAVGEEAVLTVMARKEAKLGLILLDMKRAVKDLEAMI